MYYNCQRTHKRKLTFACDERRNFKRRSSAYLPYGYRRQQAGEEYLNGREEVFAKLLEKHLSPVFNFLYRITGSKEVAEDLAQETFVKVWKNLKNFNRNRSFKAWLFTIAKNTTYDYFKKKKEVAFSAFVNEEGESIFNEIAGENILPDEILHRKDIANELEEILKKLPPHYRAILLLHYKEDFSLHEIAEILGEPYNTIKSRHQRGLGKLKKIVLF